MVARFPALDQTAPLATQAQRLGPAQYQCGSSVLAIEAFPGGEELCAEEGGHGDNACAGVAVELHTNRGGHFDDLWHESLYRRTVEVRGNGGDVRVALHQTAALAVETQVEVVTDRARFFLADLGHLFHDRLEFSELSVVDFEIDQQPYAVRCHACLLNPGELSPASRNCPTQSWPGLCGALNCLTYVRHSGRDNPLLLVVNELGVDLLAVGRGTFGFQRAALAIFREFDLTGAHGLAALHVVDLQRAVALGCDCARVHGGHAGHGIGLAIELPGPFRVRWIP